MSNASDSLATYHHPLFLAREVQNTYTHIFRFRPFSGNEPKPLCPQGAYRDSSVTRDQLTQLETEYSQARMEWAAARFRSSVTHPIPNLKEKWNTFRMSLEEMNAAFSDLVYTEPDDTWKNQILDLSELHREAENSAREWDVAAYPVAVQYREYRDVTEKDGPETLTSLLCRCHGLNVPSFALGVPEEYEEPQPTADSVTASTPAVQYIKDRVNYHNKVIEFIFSS